MSTRCHVTPDAKAWMDLQLQLWQVETSKSSLERPPHGEWYLAKRTDAINAGLLTELHCPDVVRSYLKAKTNATACCHPASSWPRGCDK